LVSTAAAAAAAADAAIAKNRNDAFRFAAPRLNDHGEAFDHIHFRFTLFKINM
jgi:hypothetical protein